MVSTVNGPIPPHPYYDKTDQNTYLNIPAPRVRPEAEEYARKGQGTICLGLEIEGHTIPPAYRRSKTEVKDHFRENYRRMRQIQKQSFQKETENRQQPVKALWKSAKYDSIESKVKEELQKSTFAPRPHSTNYLRAHSRTGFLPQSARPASVEPPEDKLTIPRAATARDIGLVRRELDFIKINGIGARKYRIPRSPSLTALDDMKKASDDKNNVYRKGEVPKYLVERKETWRRETEERFANIPDPDMPPGHRMMPEADRVATLTEIRQKQTELLRELSSLPIRNDTMRLQKKHEELEEKLAKVEEAIKIFSRPKVFVKLDS